MRNTRRNADILSQSAEVTALEDLLRLANCLPLKGELCTLDPSQRSYLVAAAKRYGVYCTWMALMRAVETGNYGPEDVVRVTWAILKKQKEPAVRK